MVMKQKSNTNDSYKNGLKSDEMTRFKFAKK